MNELKEELIDRFGDIDDDLLLYMYEKIIKSYCKKLNIYKINKTNRRYLDFVFDAKASQNMDGMKLFNKAQELKYVSLTYKNYEIHILFEIQGRNKIDYFKDICTYFDKIS